MKQSPEPAARISALRVSDVSKAFGRNRALVRVSLTVEAGEVHCLVGENGSGKSTLIKILSGYHVPDEGSIAVSGQPLETGSPLASRDLGCRFVHQDLALIPDRTVLDNLSLGTGYPTRMGTIRRKAAISAARRDLERIGIDCDPLTLVEDLPPATKTEVAISRALRSDPASPTRLLVLDEPTATLPASEVSRLLDLIRTVARQGVGVLYVTHRLDELFEIGDRVSVLRDGRLVATNRILNTTRDDVVTQLTGSSILEAGRVEEVRSSEQRPQGMPVLQVSDLVGDELGGVSFEAMPGEIVGIAGLTGSGRDSLLSTVFGATRRLRGSVRVEGHEVKDGRPDLAISAGVAYLPVDRKAFGGILDLSGRENLVITDVSRFWNHLFISRRREREDACHWYERLDVRPRTATEEPLASFSGGNQQKILFGKWLRRSPKVFLLDEPTQGVDIGARRRLHELLVDAAESGAAVVVSSSDSDELVTLCDRVLLIAEGQIVAEYPTNDLSGADLSRSVLVASSRTEGP